MGGNRDDGYIGRSVRIHRSTIRRQLVDNAGSFIPEITTNELGLSLRNKIYAHIETQPFQRMKNSGTMV